MKKTAYPKYKDSGVEWLGKIPKHWEVSPIRTFAKREYRSFIDGDWIESPYIQNEGIRLLQTGNIGIGKYREKGFRYIDEKTFNDLRCTEVKPSDILICRLADPVGRSCLAPNLNSKMIASVDICILKPSTHIDPQFVVYILSNKSYLLWMSSICRGGTRDRISRNMLGAIKVQNPPFQEQKSIADFLDKETSRIDSLIQKKEQQIELLKEKRLVLITQVVTKGLDPNVKMKDSGIEWLKKIPDHWKIKKIKYIAEPNPSNINKKSKEGEKEIFLCNYVEVYKNEYIDDTLHFMKATATIDQISKFILKKGDVIVTKDSEVRNDIAVPALVTKNFNDVVCGYHLTHIKPKKILGDYLFRCFQSKWLQSYFEVSANGITRYGISVDEFNSALILIPPIQEQKNISHFLDKETAQIDSLTEKIKKSIEILKEYRSALITSAVTGKMDVRDSQAEITNIIQFQKSKIESLKPIKTIKPVLVAKKASQKEVNPLFKKTVLGAEIVTQLKNDPHFGRTKFMKTLYLCEAHLQIPLQGQYKREAAGPLDNSIYKMEDIMKKNKWFKTVKIDSMYKYKSLENSKGYKSYFDKYWRNYTEKLNQLLSLVKKFTTEQSEIVDTIYAVWNDFLMEGKNPSDSEIIDEVENNWHKRKKRFPDNQLRKAIQWVREQNLIPQGYGPKTKSSGGTR